MPKDYQHEPAMQTASAAITPAVTPISHVLQPRSAYGSEICPGFCARSEQRRRMVALGADARAQDSSAAETRSVDYLQGKLTVRNG